MAWVVALIVLALVFGRTVLLAAGAKWVLVLGLVLLIASVIRGFVARSRGRA